MIPNLKKCHRGHGVDSDHCYMCDQEDRDQAAADDKFVAMLKRLKAEGKLKGVID